MSSISSSGFKSSVAAAIAVTITALVAWSFESYTAHLERRADQSIASAQVESSTPDFGSDSQNG